jgi:1,4-alpha-glucan branching enzyme
MATKKAATPKVETPAVEATAVKTAKKASTKKVETPVAEALVATTAKKAATKKVETTTKVTFTLPKQAVQTAKNVAVVGEFNNWDILNGVALKKQKDGSFSTTLELEGGKEYQYRFLINGEVWENAWDAPKYVPTPFGTYNSVVLA